MLLGFTRLAHKEGDESAIGTISNDDAMSKAWIARFGRTVGEQVVEAVEVRTNATPEAGSSVTLAGHGLGIAGREDIEALEQRAWVERHGGSRSPRSFDSALRAASPKGDETLEPVPGRERRQSTGRLEPPTSGGEIDVEVVGCEPITTHGTAVLDDVATAELAKGGEEDRRAGEGAERTILVQTAEDDPYEGLVAVAMVPQHAAVPAHHVGSTQGKAKTGNAGTPGKLRRKHRNPWGNQRDNILSILFLYVQNLFPDLTTGEEKPSAVRT